MKIGFIGLGKMGGAMVERLLGHGHEVVVFDQNPDLIKAAAVKGAASVHSLNELIKNLKALKIIWLMVPAGQPVQELIRDLTPLLSEGDMLIDGGNSHYKETLQRAQAFKKQGIQFLDVGTSGGIWGLENGYCLMAGGEPSSYKQAQPLFAALSAKQGYAHVGPSGAGHFLKMVHNGIEYGMLQAYGEGFELIQASDFKFDLAKTAHLWNHGSVVRSWLLELAGKMFQEDPGLASLQAYIEDSGEGRWAVQDAIEKGISAPVITLSVLERLRSRTKESFSAKVIAGLRKQFGGHKALRNNK